MEYYIVNELNLVVVLILKAVNIISKYVYFFHFNQNSYGYFKLKYILVNIKKKKKSTYFSGQNLSGIL